MAREPGEPRPNEGQARALEALGSGRNVFLTGCAGTGKSFLLSYFMAQCKKDGKRAALTATTGIAALNVGGKTLHSWAGLRPHARTAAEIFKDERWLRSSLWSLRRAQVLLIEEVSMASALLLDLVEELCRLARGSEEPWGGLQVVLIGDLGQLPPVNEAEGYSFQSAAWAKSNLLHAELTQVMRQQDALFVRILNEVRLGKLSEEGAAVLGARVRAYDPNDPATPAVRVMTHNAAVDAINAAKLAEIPGAPVRFEATEFSAPHAGGEAALARLDKDCLSPRVLELKIGARVMFTRNAPTKTRDGNGRWLPTGLTYVNGSTGTVVDLSESRVSVRLDRGGRVEAPDRAEWTICGNKGESDLLASRSQVPLKLGWAVTCHKSQGQTLDRVSVDLVSVFAAGQSYVALSRCRTLEGLNVERWRGAASIFASKQVLTFLGLGAEAFGALW